MRRFGSIVLIAIALSWIACVRTDGFSPAMIQGALSAKAAPLPNPEIGPILSQPFHYFGKGRQCFVFESADGRFVLKFFNQKYLEMPWYSFLIEKKERAKRALRRSFYENSYEIAFQELGEEILYLHLGSSDDLPTLAITDRASRAFQIDLNQVSFVLQRRGESLYSHLDAIYLKEGLNGLHREIDAFIMAISQRISKNIADADTDVEHNWGYVDGRLFHLDPGRLYYDEGLAEPDRLEREWHNGTHDLHKWLKNHHPEAAIYLEQNLIMQ